MKEPLIDVANISAAFTKMYSKIFVRANSMRGLNSLRGKIYGEHGKAMPTPLLHLQWKTTLHLVTIWMNGKNELSQYAFFKL